MATKSATMAKPGNTKGVIRLFDARPDCLDCRDLPYRPPLRSLPPKYPLEPDVEHLIGEYVGAGLILDQGSEGAGTGFGLAGVANCLLWTRHIEDPVKVRSRSSSRRSARACATSSPSATTSGPLVRQQHRRPHRNHPADQGAALNSPLEWLDY